MAKQRLISGKIKWFNENKGIGIIESEEGESVFVHTTDFKEKKSNKNLKNRKVTFSVDEDDFSKEFRRAISVNFND